MKSIRYHPLFRRNFKKRISSKKRLLAKYKKAYLIFEKNPEDPILKNHFLKDDLKGFRSFSVDPDCRVIYKETELLFIFYDIGSHDQVYKKRLSK